MPLTGRHDIDNTPNTNLPYEVLTSFNEDIFASSGDLHGGGDAGYGSLSRRDVATEIVMYKPYRNALDTLIQTTGGFEVATNSVHEWTENDELMPDEATVESGDTDEFIDHTDFSATESAKFKVTEEDADIYRKGDVIRYVADSGDYTFALITEVQEPSGGEVVFEIESFDGELVQAKDETVIQRLHSLRGADLNYDVEPRGTIPKQYYTYINKIVHDARYGKRVQNEEHYMNLLQDQEDKLFNEMRRSRELQSLYGVRGKRKLSNGDWAYSSPGLYNQIADFNKDTAEMTTNDTFDKDKFTAAMYSFIEHNFGAESGGPDTRQMFVSGKFASYLSQAFVDIQRFYETEYVAGVRCMRWEHNLGNIDFIYLPILDYKHPIPDGSLKEGNGKAVGMLLPVAETVTRLVMQGEGPSSEVFKEKGGDEEENMRVKSTEGLKLKLKQYTGVMEEI